MKTTRSSSRLLPAAILAGLLAAATGATWASPRANTMPADETRPVDVVICLDTSGSMNDLLDATRARVWDVVNELGKMTPTPELRVGLLSYGTETASEDDGWIVRHLDLTGELDTVYAELMNLTTGGGTEYVGRVLNEAIDEMSWYAQYVIVGAS